MEFRILGPTEVVDDGEPVPLPRGRGRALLGVLLLRAGEVISTDRLIGDLWGETPPPTVETALQGLVSKLRRRLEPGRRTGEPPRLLLTRHPGYVLSVEPGQIDANQFRRLLAEAEDSGPSRAVGLLRAALDLWRGAALADFTYEPFAQADISALEELRLTALEKRIEAELALGGHRELIGELEGLVAEHPLRERLRAHLMLALYRSGRQAEAFDVYSDLRVNLADELGLDPGPSLQQLEGRMLRQDPSLDLEKAAVVPSAPEEWLAEKRKTVTALAVDVAVSTSTGEEPDPETARRILSRVYGEATAVVAGHGGTVERVLGSTLLGLFGIPEVREDDALRAVRAAVDLRHLIAALNKELAPDVWLLSRTGIDTGEAVVGDTATDTTGGSIRGAGLLQREAGEGDILVGEATRLLTGRAALVEPVNAEAVAGSRRPAWKVLDLATAPAVSPAETPMVDREHELDSLHAGYQRAVRENSPYRLTVLGDPGIGKSRIAREMASRLSSSAWVLTGRCPSSGEGVTFWPLREVVQTATGSLDREALLRLLRDEEDAEAITEHVLNAIGTAPSPAMLAASFRVLRRFFESLARRGPLVLILEDLHWAQPTFLDLVEYLTDSVRSPLFLLCLARPELLEEHPTWAHGTRAGSLVLGPLGPEESRVLAAARLAGRMIPERMVDDVLAAAQGNPLFVEQLVATIGEQGEISVPPTVEALLAARIDRLGPAERDVIRAASVLGHRFPGAALMSLLPEAARRHAHRHLRTLDRKELVVPHPSGDEFAFRHVLVQQAAYRSLTKGSRAELHQHAAAWLEAAAEGTELDETVGNHLERALHYHLELGDPDAKAQELAKQAGETLAGAGLRAFGRFDAAGAENLLSRARALLPPEHPEGWQVSFRLAEAYETMGKHGEAEAVLSDLLARGRKDDPRRQMLELERARVRLATGPDPTTLEEIAGLASSALAASEPAGDETRAAQAHFVLGEILLRTGRVADMEETVRRGLAHADRSASAREELGARRMLATALEVGPTPVLRCIEECEQLATWRGMENPAVLPILARLHAMNVDFDGGRELIAQAEALMRERTRARRPLGLLRKRHAEVESLAGDLDAAAHHLRRALDVNMAMGIREEASEAAALLARVLFRKGQPDRAEEMAELSQSLAPSESVIPQALWRSTRALSMAAQGEVEQAVRLGQEAIDLVPSALVNLRADLLLDLAQTLATGGRSDAAREARDAGINTYERKGNVAAASQARLLVAVGR